MKTIKKIMFVAMTLLMLAGIVNPVAADNYTPVAGTTTTLTKYLVVPSDAEIPASTFSFSVSAGSAVEATATTVKVWAGLNPSSVKVNSTAGTGTVTFTAGETATAGTGAAPDNVATTKKFATKTITLDFSDVNFPEPGVYRYLLTEAASTNAAITIDSQPVRTIDVYVVDNNGDLEVSGYACYPGTMSAGANIDGTDLTTKSDRFVNETETHNLTVSKTVTGNAGSKDQYFEFTVTIAGAGNGTVLTLDMSGAETSTHENSATSFAKASMDAANARDDDTGASAKAGQQIICDASGGATVTAYLHHGQQLVLKGLPKGATYTVAETAAAGYTTTGTVATATAIDAADVTVAVTNNRTEITPTGVAIAAGSGLAIMAVAYVLFVSSSRKKASRHQA